MKASFVNEESRAIFILRRKIKQQEDMIQELRESNGSLHSDLEIEKGLTRMYIDRLQCIEEQWMSRMRTLKGFVKDIHQVMSPHDSPPSEMNNEARSPDFEETSRVYSQEGAHSVTTPRTSHTSEVEMEETNLRDQPSPHSSTDSCEICEEEDHSPVASPRHQLPLERPLPRWTARVQSNASVHRNRTTETQTGRQNSENPSSHPRNVDHFVAPGIDRIQRLLLMRESYEKRKAMFIDDLTFIREVHEGISLAPEMDIGVELKNLAKTFKRWNIDFKEELRSTEMLFKQVTRRRIFATRR